MGKRTNKKHSRRRTKKLSKQFIKLKCSPKNKAKHKDYSCYSKNELYKMRCDKSQQSCKEDCIENPIRQPF